jgi:hypothetical protein
MGDNLESVATVQRDGWCVVLFHGENNVAWFAQGTLEQLLRDPLTTHLLDDPQPRDVEKAFVTAHEDVADELVIHFRHPPLPSMELVLEHALGHRIRKQGVLEGEERRDIQPASCSEHASEDTRETSQ